MIGLHTSSTHTLISSFHSIEQEHMQDSLHHTYQNLLSTQAKQELITVRQLHILQVSRTVETVIVLDEIQVATCMALKQVNNFRTSQETVYWT